MSRLEVLIEKWFPVDIIGAESMRERGASSALPPLYFLHVWWARRPLTASRAAILASVLPAWDQNWPPHLRRKFPTEETYRAWFIKLCGIFGDPVAGRKLVIAARDKDIKLKIPPYGYKRAFTVSPSKDYLDTLEDLLEHSWGKRRLSMADPFAGGGSIPFEALRYGFTTHANELNPVANIILRATLDYPFNNAPSLAKEIRKYGKMLADKIRAQIEQFFPINPDESVHAYLWARTVTCPYTGKPIPLSPNWWLRKAGEPVAALPIFDPEAREVAFEIVQGESAVARCKPDRGTITGGNAISPWAHNQPVTGSYIKAEAQAGRMKETLYAVVVKTKDGFHFRTPTEQERGASIAAEAELKRKASSWEAAGILPTEKITETSNYERGHRLYGLRTWRDAFLPRQFLVLGTALHELREVTSALYIDLPKVQADAVITYLGIAIDKAVDYNSRFTRWDSTRTKIVNSFDKHGYSFLWSHPEFDGAHNLIPWVIDQVSDAYTGMATLAQGAELFDSLRPKILTLQQGTAVELKLPNGSIDHICVDPPYEANVMYAECSDFFFVWMKRSLGGIHPEFFRGDETNKDDEAVANQARFAELGRQKKKLALEDYERKMAAAFREMYRVLTPDGVLTVMFTHKRVEAWDTLATSLIGAGFTIHSSWPVHTESEHSLHQAKKNAAQSTILLTCRKRTPKTEPVWWDDLQGQVRRTAREKAQEFERQGIRGVDLYIATFGPTLSILSENWPVLTSEMDEWNRPKPLRPEVALDLARQEVVELRKQGLLLGRTVQFDPYTDWYLMAWDAFRAEEFPGDEARKLALALGLDLERQVISEKRLITKKGSGVVLLQPNARRRRGIVDPEQTVFEYWIDAAHTAMLLYREDGARACEQFLRNAGLRTDSTFRALLQALLNAIPRTYKKGKFVRPEAEVLEAMRLAFFDDLQPPSEEEVDVRPLQQEMFRNTGLDDDEEEVADLEDDEEEKES